MTFNEFLVSDEGRQKLNNRQADLLLARLQRHRVTIRWSFELCDFMDAYPEYFCLLTEQEIRDGLQTMRTMWDKYQERQRSACLPLRQLGGARRASVVTLTLVSPGRPFRGFGRPTWSR